MKALKQVIALIVITAAVVLTGCDNKPLLTEMSSRKLVVVLKGTYESNSPMPWNMPKACATWEDDPDEDDPEKLICSQYTIGHRVLVQDDSVNNCNATEDVNPTFFMLDIAEVRLADANGNQHKFANYRQSFAFPMTESHPFFNGIGYVMDNDDVPSKLYPGVMLYVRKMLLDSAQKYVPSNTRWSPSSIWDVYAEKQYPSFNFNKMQVHSFYDTLRYESSYLNRVFPMVVWIPDATKGMIYNTTFPVTVLEIRFVVWNFVKKYEYEAYINDLYSVVHYYGLSDWLQDVRTDETVIGGNVLTVARSYIPGLVGRISGTNPRSHGAHIIAIPAGADIGDYTIPGTRDSLPDSTDWEAPYTTPPVSQRVGPRNNNTCDLSKSPSAYLGTSIDQLLDYYLKVEKYKYEWNDKVPQTKCAPAADCCYTYDNYKENWDTFKDEVSDFKVPQLAVYAGAGATFSFENVPPGTYDVYVATDPPRYGYLYYDGQFGAAPQWSNVNVSVGSNTGL